MLLRITSWFRNSFRLGPGTTTGMPGLQQILPAFWKNHPRLGGGIAICCVFFLLILIGLAWNLTPVSPGKSDLQLVEIEYGSSLREVSRLLKDKKIIRSQFVFEAYVRLDLKNRMAKAGWYHIGPGFSVPKLARELHRGTPQNIKLTIPEGLTIKEIGALLERKNLCSQEQFLAKTRDISFINGILGDFQIGSSLEGYLFPDTYDFALPVSAEEVISKMLQRFKEVFEENFGNLPQTKRREMVIIASLVEMEARRADERPVIAGVFYNRLRLGYRLESCATVQYVLGTHRQLYYKDLKVESPYNTYLHYGLPPGPIANPGLASLKAAASPASVRYLYFVAKPDGAHIFSTNYRDHLRAQRQVERLQTASQTGRSGN